MGLGLSNGNGGGDFLPIVKWDARAGRFFRVDRTQGANGWKSNDVDLTMDRPKFCVDLGSIEVGHMAFLPTGPDFHLAPLGAPMPAKPTKEHKAGFRVKLAGNALNGVREFASSAKSVLAAMDALHSEFEASPEAAAGKVPVVELAGSTTVVTTGPNGKVTSYSPVFRIVAWVDRIAELGARTVPPPAGKPGPTAAYAAPPAAAYAAPPNHVPPPAAHVPPPAAHTPVAAPPAAMPF